MDELRMCVFRSRERSFLYLRVGVCWTHKPTDVHFHNEKDTSDIVTSVIGLARDLHLNDYWRYWRKHFLAKNNCV